MNTIFANNTYYVFNLLSSNSHHFSIILVAITASPSSGRKIGNAIIKCDEVQYSVGITNLTAFRATGRFTCEHEGLYIITASLMSFTPSARYYVSLNGKDISQHAIDHSNSDDDEDQIGAVTLTRQLHPNDQVWLQGIMGFQFAYFYGGDASTFTIIKIK